MYIAHIFRVSVAHLQFFNGPTTKNWAEPYQSIETSDTQSHITWQALIGRPFIFVEKKFLLFLSKKFSLVGNFPIPSNFADQFSSVSIPSESLPFSRKSFSDHHPWLPLISMESSWE
ncbi:putative protein [Arabidopsis thaliana]|uniref:At4g39930 n=1 Tax=Arabidopsis thaliana TaxID=3702 RepID=Q9SMR1_ARATH|nr:uncharacterized protein AT4G39930 [Arabidopsis thaliana]NP_195703.1 uncharacterized protein AT4G39930 [Arabidopsis thaliana]AAS99661.1 At4g39930 [Arabidopsis thaliana]AAT71968.1 At4g39930 [Arabidopsis thaliana]AEE87140.1 hypothetical protein AT4G39930 [Arabidopsis thaliana]AEE87141.1 hypothetical protein AT4G39930 [Arabidopsis thaliana]CAB38906.1 putative protein [Arabidopsis thaliana]|eukprot:NP_001190976.1 hypothetical protein AT4G39930 [Arabidopsis thaliana]